MKLFLLFLVWIPLFAQDLPRATVEIPLVQNQSLADSDADLAQDLRREVHEMIDAGQSDDDIVQFMVARYGDFVLYRPQFKARTYLLWLGPFLLLAAVLVWLVRRLRTSAA